MLWINNKQSRKNIYQEKCVHYILIIRIYKCILTQSKELLQEKKIRLRIYNESNFLKNNIPVNIEKKISSVEGRFKVTKKKNYRCK